ncbi:MAG TPA: hypothetical protein DCM57_02375 [Treponema sp.]|nr:hypothetical protein [Treponema sp.]
MRANKKSTFYYALPLVFSALILFVACPQVGGSNASSTGGTETPVQPDSDYLEKAYTALTVTTLVEGETASISLPSTVPGYSAASVKWKSDSPSVISTDGNVVHSESEDKNVKLTAEISYDGKTKTREFNVLVKKVGASVSDSDYVSSAKTALSIVSEVHPGTERIDLPSSYKVSGTVAVNVAWVSENASVITDDGNVTYRAGKDFQNMTMTATLTKGSASPQTKVFTVRVYDDVVLYVNKAKEALSIPTDVPADENEITLPTSISGYTGVSVSWSSGKTSVISNTGAIIHEHGTGSTNVTLTATLSCGETTAKKTFNVAVQKDPTNYLAAAKNALSISSTVSSGSTSINLPNSVTGYDGVSVTWASSNSSIVSGAGIVSAPAASGTSSVTLTATLTYGGKTETKTFPVTVENDWAAYLENAKTKLVLSDSSLPSSADSIILPSSVADYSGVSVAWTSSKPSVISAAGKVSPEEGSGRTSVTLTATLSCGTKTAAKTFNVSVMQKAKVITAADILNMAVENLSATINSLIDPSIYYPQSIQLPGSITVNDGSGTQKNVSIYWNSVADERHLRAGEKRIYTDMNSYYSTTVSPDYVTIYRDIRVVSTSANVTLSYGGETKTCDIAVSIPPVTSFSSRSTSGDYSDHTVIEGDSITRTISGGGTKYTIKNLDTAKQEVSVVTTQIRLGMPDSSGTVQYSWMTKSDVVQVYKNAVLERFKAFRKVNSNQTIENLLVVAIMESRGSTETEDDLYRVLLPLGVFEGLGTSPTDDAVAQAKALDEEKKAAAVKLFMEFYRTHGGVNMTGNPNASWDEICTYGEQNAEAEARKIADQQFVSGTYTYSVEYANNYSGLIVENNVGFNSSAVFDPSKSWYEQPGNWSNNGSSKYANLQISSSLSLSENLSETFNSHQNGTFNASHTAITFRDGTTWNTVYDSSSKTVTITNAADSSQTAVLSFSGISSL